ncbi:hypothetical protein K438DRAFT_1948795 [Mycena galopus ATCC 62051]|nr:hypothetical protein K438DRAFT_1948795 [Mycena galopus ATCC 62051]
MTQRKRMIKLGRQLWISSGVYLAARRQQRVRGARQEREARAEDASNASFVNRSARRDNNLVEGWPMLGDVDLIAPAQPPTRRIGGLHSCTRERLVRGPHDTQTEDMRDFLNVFSVDLVISQALNSKVRHCLRREVFEGMTSWVCKVYIITVSTD